MQQLTLNETRVIGSLIEKCATTPDQYPLSLNSLTTACNQKSNREPVLELSESDVQQALDDLISHNLVAEVRYGSRVPKYQHRFGSSEFAEVRYNQNELAVLCLLFLRGAQTPGELRTRSARLTQFKDIAEVEAVLNKLATHESGPFVIQLAREPGKREQRWMHLFSGEVDPGTVRAPATEHPASNPQPDTGDLQSRVTYLEEELAAVKAEFAEFKAQLQDLLN